MEDFQKSKIQDNFFSLITRTDCSLEFLEKFKSHQIFSFRDIHAITVEHEDTSAMDHAYQFYKRILETKSDTAFNILLTALRNTHQHVPYDILTRGKTNPTATTTPDSASSLPPAARLIPRKPPLKSQLSELQYLDLTKDGDHFESPPTAIRHFSTSGTHNLLLLKCQDTQVTLARILDTLKGVKLVDSDFILNADPGTLGVIKFTGNDQSFKDTVKKLAKTHCKFIILHSKDQFPEIPKGPVVFKAEDSLKWEELTQPFQMELGQKIRTTCCVGLRPTPDVLQGNALIMLIQADAKKTNISLLGDMFQAYLEQKLGNINANHDDLMEDLARVLIRSAYPVWEQVVFPINQTYKNEAALNHLASGGVLSRTLKKISFEYEFSNRDLGYFCLAVFASKPGNNLGGFSKVLLAIREIQITLGGQAIQAFEFENRLRIYFLDFFLDPENGPNVGSWGNLQNLAIACIIGSCSNLLQYILPKITVKEEMLLLATTFGTGRIFDLVMKSYGKAGKITGYKFQEHTLLHIALKAGKLETVSKLLFDYGFVNIIQKNFMRNLMHTCVQDTLNISEAGLRERAEILALLLNTDRKLLHEKVGKTKETPLLSPKVHLGLVKLLINFGADVYAVREDADSTTLGSYCGDGRTPQEYHAFIKYLKDAEYIKLLQTRDNSIWTYLHYAVDYLDPLEETIALFKQIGVGINDSNIKKITTLHQAIKMKRSAGCIRQLIRLGALVNSHDVEGRSPLWYALHIRGAQNDIADILRRNGAVEE